MGADISTVRSASHLLDRFEVLWRDRLDPFAGVLAELPPAEQPQGAARVWQLWPDPRLVER